MLGLLLAVTTAFANPNHHNHRNHHVVQHRPAHHAHHVAPAYSNIRCWVWAPGYWVYQFHNERFVYLPGRWVHKLS